MDYSKKPVSQSRHSRTTARKTAQLNAASSQKNQSNVRTTAFGEHNTAQRQIRRSDAAAKHRRPSGTVSKRQTESVNRQTVQKNQTRVFDHSRNTSAVDNTRSITRKKSSTEKAPVSTYTAGARSRQTAQRKAAVRNASAQKQTIPPRGPAMMPPKKRRRPFSKPLKIAIVSVLIVLIGGTGYCWWLITGNLNKDLTSSAVCAAYHISDEAAAMAQSQNVVNIAIFGIDGRDDPEVIGDRSDAIMIASADFERGGVKIASIMRDTYVWIEEEDAYDKINAAYSIGGAETAIQTINQNFDTPITDYVTVNFDCMVLMVNAVGGVEVTIEDPDVLYWTNQYLGDVNTYCGTNSSEVPGLGTQTLDGSQALAYCRVRYTGNGDFDRTLRQREVFKQVILKALDLNPFAQFRLLQDVLPYIETSLTTNEIMKYALNVMLMNNKGFSQMQLPASDYCETGYYNDISYVFPVTLTDSIKTWYQFVYERDYTPSQEARSISQEISYIW